MTTSDMDKNAPKDDLGAMTAADILARNRELLHLGQYDGALTALDQLLQREDVSQYEKVEIYRAAARVFLHRGFPRQAGEWLAKASELSEANLNHRQRLALDVHKIFVLEVGCGEEANDDLESRLVEAQHYLDSFKDTVDLDTDLVEMHTFLARIPLVRQVLRDRKGTSVKSQVSSQMLELARGAMQNRRYAQLNILVSTILVSSEQDVALKWLEETLQVAELPVQVRGSLSLELAKILAARGRLDDCRLKLDAAEDAFRLCDHAFGALDVQMVRLEGGLSQSSDVLLDMVNIANRHLQANYVLGFMQAAMAAFSQAFQNSNFRAYNHLQAVLHSVGDQAGIQHEQLLREVQLLSVLNIGGSDAGKVLELGKRLHRECIVRRYWSPAYLVGRIISLCHSQLLNYEESVTMAQDIYDMCVRERLMSESEAAYHLAFARSQKARKQAKDFHAEVQTIVHQLLITIEGDVADGSQASQALACQKLGLIAGLQFEMARKATSTGENMKNASDNAAQSLNRARTLADALPEDTKLSILADLDSVMISQLLHEGKHLGHNDKEDAAIAICDALIQIYHTKGPKFSEAIKYMMRAACQLQKLQKEPNILKRLPFMVAAEADYSTATGIFESIHSNQQTLLARHNLTRVHVEACYSFKTQDIIKMVFGSLEMLEQTVDKLRRELSALGSLRALLQKQQLVSTDEVRDLYRWAIAVSYLEQRPQDLWYWSQKRKARSLSDLLGIGVLIPVSIREDIAADEDAERLYTRLTSLTAALRSAPEGEVLYMTQQLEEVENEIRAMPAFSGLVALRDGRVGGIVDLKRLSGQKVDAAKRRQVIFVEWIAHGDQILILTANTETPEESCQLTTLPIGVASVKQWTQENFATNATRKFCLQRDSLKDSSKPLRKLDALIGPVLRASNPGDLLIFSVTGCLSAIPLHALRIADNGKVSTLIERNPVVYAPSFPILDICLTNSRETPLEHSEPLFVGIYDVEREANTIYGQLRRLASSTNGTAICGSEANKTSFTTTARNLRHLHYHGHCHFAVDNPLKQCLVLAAETTATRPSEGHDPESAGVDELSRELHDSAVSGMTSSLQALPALSETTVVVEDSDESLLLGMHEGIPDNALAVPDIFKLRLRAALVLLIGCDSGSQAIAEGDEPLGLISGLLCAGAASVIGVSWPIPSSAGRQFSDHFYAQMNGGTSGGDEPGWFDIASGLQEAVLQMMDDPDTSAPYYWAGFCLHGSWMYRR